MSVTKNFDSLDLEFQYYCSLVEELFSLLRSRNQQQLATNWYHKLTDPMYNAGLLREKRNQYLLMLTFCLTLGELKHPFDRNPFYEVLPKISSIHNPKKASSCCHPECLENKQKPTKTCDFHENGCPSDSDNIGKVLDEQFKLLIKISELNVDKLSDPSDRHRGRNWINYLLQIDTQCFQMKKVRNDYAMLLSGYVVNDELPGPFLQSPTEKLIALEDLVTIVDMNNHMVIDPSHPKAMKFFKDVPHPTEGAFAFLAVTGNICDS